MTLMAGYVNHQSLFTEYSTSIQHYFESSQNHALESSVLYIVRIALSIVAFRLKGVHFKQIMYEYIFFNISRKAKSKKLTERSLSLLRSCLFLRLTNAQD